MERFGASRQRKHISRIVAACRLGRVWNLGQSRPWWRASKGVRIRPLVGKSAPDKSSASDDNRAPRRGIGAAPFRECPLRGARARQQRRKAVVPLVTPRLIVKLIRRVALLLQLLLDGPRSDPRRRIVDRHDILDCVRAKTRPPFNEVQVSVSSLEV